MKSKKIAYCGLLTTVALLLSYVERMIAIPMIVPGMKLGLANITVLIALYLFDNKTAFCISILRILISGILFTGFASFLYSAAGALLSFIIMSFLQKKKCFFCDCYQYIRWYQPQYRSNFHCLYCSGKHKTFLLYALSYDIGHCNRFYYWCHRK